MKTYDFTIKDLLNKGLRPLEESPRNGLHMTAASNCRPSVGGLVQGDKYTRSFNINEAAQIFHTYKGTFVLTADSIYSYSYYEDAITLLIDTIPPGLMWSIADFGEYILFTNGNINLIRNPSTGVFAADTGLVFPVARCMCAHRGRLLLGAPKRYPDLDGNHSNWASWSDINSIRFVSATEIDLARQNLSGSMPMPWEGDVLRIMPLGDKVIVYGDNGITALQLASTTGAASTYGQVPIEATGLRTARSLTTNGKEDEGSVHYFINNTGWLCSLDSNLKVTRLGYKEFLD